MHTSINTSVFLFTVIFMLFGCINSGSEHKLLKNPEKSAEIMTLISSDSSMSESMLDYLILNKKANQQLKNRVKTMMTKDFLMEQMKDDSLLTNEVMCSVMEMAEKDQLVCQQMIETIERYDLKEKLELNLIDKPIVKKDNVQVKKYLKVPDPKNLEVPVQK